MKPRIRVRARRDPALVLVQPAFVDGSEAAQACRELAEQCDRGEVVSVAIVGQYPTGPTTTRIVYGRPMNVHSLVSGCMTLLRCIQDDMDQQ